MTNKTYIPARPEGFDYDAALAELQEKIRRKDKVKKLIVHFSEESARLTSVMEDRKKEYDVEQEEADALREASLTLWLYALLGVKDEKLDAKLLCEDSAKFLVSVCLFSAYSVIDMRRADATAAIL